MVSNGYSILKCYRSLEFHANHWLFISRITFISFANIGNNSGIHVEFAFHWTNLYVRSSIDMIFITILTRWKYSDQNTWYKFTLCSVFKFPWCRKASKKSEIAKNPKDYYDIDELFSPKPGSKRPGIPFQFNNRAKQRLESPLAKIFLQSDEKKQETSDERLKADKSPIIKIRKPRINIKSCGNSCNDDNDTL